MMLEYENTIDDIVAFQLYHLANSPTVKNKIRVHFVVIIVALGAAIFLATGSWRDAVVPVTATTLLGYLILQSKGLGLVAQSQGKTLRKSLAEQNAEAICGRRRLVLSENTLNEETAIVTHAIRYTALGEIKDTEKYIFIYVNPLGAIVIPRRDQDPLMLESFIREVRNRMSPEQHPQRESAT
jgi:hypothetical protein